MLPSTVVVVRQLPLRYNKCNIKYIFCNKPFKAFLDVQMSKVKPTPLLAIKNLLFLMRRSVLFSPHSQQV